VLRLDSEAAEAIAQDPLITSKRSKHIDIRYHHVRQLVADDAITLEHVPSADNLADILTKPLGPQVFIPLRESIGLSAPGGPASDV
jgi:hypothetical protein